MFKNIASQNVTLYVIDASTGLPKTGDAANMVFYVSKDDGSVTQISSNSGVPTEVDSTNGKGLYKIALSQTETNADKLLFSGKSVTANIVVAPAVIYTTPANFSTTSIDSSGRIDLGKWIGTAPNTLNAGRVDAITNIRSSTAQAGAAGTITLDASSSATDNFYNDSLVFLTGGTGAGQVRAVQTYVGSTKVATIFPNWATNPDNTSTFTIIPGGQVDVGNWLNGTIPAVNITGVPLVDAKYLLGTIFSTPATAGIIDVNIKNMNNVAGTSITTINANQGTTQPINFTGTGASALAKSDVVDIAGAAVSTSTAQIGANVVNWSGSAVTAPNTAGVPIVDTRDIARQGTAQSTGNSTTAIKLDASASATTDFYKRMMIRIISGTGAPEYSICTAYDGTTKIATVSPAWATAPDNTSIFQVVMKGEADVEIWSGTAVAAPATAGYPVVTHKVGTGTGELNITSGVVDADAKKINAVSTSSVTTVNANQGTTQPINFTGTAGSALAKSDMVDIAGAAVSTSTAQIGTNVVNWSGSAVTSPNTAGVPVVDTREIARQGTAQASGNSTTAIKLDASASATTDFYKRMLIRIVSGTGAPEYAVCTAYDGTTKIATVSPAWATAPDNTSVFQVIMAGEVDVEIWSGTAVAAPATAGYPVVTHKVGTGTGELNITSGVVDADAKKINAVSTSSVTTINANQGTTQPVNFTGTGASALAKSDMVDIAGAAVSTSTAQIGSNVVNWSGSAVVSPNTAGVPIVDTRSLVRQGTAQSSGNTTTAIKLDSSASATDDFYKGMLIQVISGTGSPEAAICTSYVGSTKIATVAPAWPTAPDGTSVFQIFPAKTDVEVIKGTATAGAAGYVGIDWGNVNSPSTTVSLSGTTVATVTTVTNRVTANVDQIAGNATAATNLSNVYLSFETGTAQAGASTTITLRSGASAVNDFFKDQVIFLLSGTGAGQTNRITAYNGTTKVATVETTWATTPSATTVYVVLGRVG